MATLSSKTACSHWRPWVRAAICVAVLTCPLSLQAALALSPEDAETAARGTFREWVEVLGIPNVSTVPADIERNTAWFEHAFQRRGFRTRQLPNDGKPMLFTEAPNAKPSSTTVLFYAHLDGQPVNPAEWAQESPGYTEGCK